MDELIEDMRNRVTWTLKLIIIRKRELSHVEEYKFLCNLTRKSVLANLGINGS